MSLRYGRSGEHQRRCERCRYFGLWPQILYGGGEGYCVIHGSQVYAPRPPSAEDERTRHDRYIQREFDYREEDFDYDLSEEDEDDEEDYRE